MQNIEETIAKYAIDANLFRLESSNPKKISAPGCFMVGGEAPTKKKKLITFSKMFQYINMNIFFSQKWSNLHERSGIGWIKRKPQFQIFQIFIFRVMVFFVLKSLQFSMNFQDNSKNKNCKNWFLIRVIILRIFHKNRIKTEGGGSAYL